MSEKNPEIVASTNTELRHRVLPDGHFEFRDGDVANRVDAEPESRPVLPRREARLRPEYTHIYPCLVPDVWELAAIVVDKVLAWRLQQRRGLVDRDRLLDPRHFDFRDLSGRQRYTIGGVSGSAEMERRRGCALAGTLPNLDPT